MKINLTFDSKYNLSGYTNIDPFPLPKENDTLLCHPENLDLVINDGEADEIIANMVLNHIEYKKIESCLNNWCKKLSHNGTLEIYYLDTLTVANGTTLK